MVALSRLVHKIFGRTATFSTQMGKFGSLKNGSPAYAVDASEIQSLSNFENGLYDAIIGNNSPAIPDINGILHHTSRQVGYLYEKGLAEWDAGTIYYINSLVGHEGQIYRSTTDSNLANSPTSSTANWIKASVLPWLTTTTYHINDIAFYNGLLYRSITNTNLNNIPSSSPANWFPTEQSILDRLAYSERHRNYIINGAMDFCQRFETGSQSGLAGQHYFVDRFIYSRNGTFSHTISRPSNCPTVAQSGFAGTYSFLLDCITAQASMGASDYSQILYRMEGLDFANLKNHKCFLSFWVKATKTGIYSVSYGNSAGTASYVSEYTINAIDTWEKKTVMVDFSTAPGAWEYSSSTGMIISWTIASGSVFQTSSLNTWLAGVYTTSTNQVNGVDSIANNFSITQVMMMPVDPILANIDVPFVRAGKTMGGELAYCQRYYEKSWDIGIAVGTVTPSGEMGIYVYPITAATTAQAVASARFKVTKRGTPAVHAYNPSTGAIDFYDTASGQKVATPYVVNTSSMSVATPTTVGANTNVASGYYQFTADAEL